MASLSSYPRFATGAAALACSFGALNAVWIVIIFVKLAKQPIRLLYASVVCGACSAVPLSLAFAIAGTHSHYPRSDDWGHIQVAMSLIFFSFVYAFQGHEYPVQVDVKGRLEVFATWATIDTALFGLVGIVAASAHLWTVTLSGNEHDIFHVKTALLMVFVGASQWLFRYCFLGRFHVPDPTIGIGSTVIASMFLGAHHQPSEFSYTTHKYFSVLIALFGWSRSLSTLPSLHAYCCFISEKNVRDYCGIARTRSVVLNCTKCGKASSTRRTKVNLPHKTQKECPKACSCTIPLDLLSAFLCLWGGFVFLLSSKRLLKTISLRFGVAEYFVGSIGMASCLLLCAFLTILQNMSSRLLKTHYSVLAPLNESELD